MTACASPDRSASRATRNCAISVPSAAASAPLVGGGRLVVVALSVWFHFEAGTGALYLLAALASGAVFTWHTVALLRDSSAARAMRVFGYSISYLGVLFCAMAVDVLVREGI